MNSINYLKKVKGISTKGITKDFIDKFSILNGPKRVSSEIFQNYLAFKPAKNAVNTLLELLALNRGNLMGSQKKVLKILVNQAAILLQLL